MLSVTSTSTLAGISIVAVIVLAIGLKYKIIQLKKITVGGVGVEFENSRRNILNESELTNLSSVPPVQQETSFVSAASNSLASEDVIVVHNPMNEPVNEILESTTIDEQPISSRTRSKQVNV